MAAARITLLVLLIGSVAACDTLRDGPRAGLGRRAAVPVTAYPVAAYTAGRVPPSPVILGIQ